MNSVVKKLGRDEKGAALILALILLLIGGLISASLLGYMGTGILAGEIYERRTAELYAADAGVEDAIWKIQYNDGYLPCNLSSPPRAYTITDVNGKNVEVTIEYVNNVTGSITYKITSIAATEDGGNTAAIVSATTVESYVSTLYMDFSALLDHAIVSYNTITIQPGNEVYGDVWLPDEEDLTISPPSSGVDEVIYGEVKDEDDLSISWPTAEQLSAYYYEDVEGTYDPGPSIDVEYTKIIGACYRDGDLVVDNTGDPATLVLEGTVYVTGDLEFQQSGSHNYTVNLNGNTIFVEGEIRFPSQRVSISGSGCIIAVGNINFQPSIASGEDDFVLVMSITGEVQFNPSGEFTGCIAGNAHVQLQPGCTINWISPEGKGLDFPGASGGDEPPPINVMNIDSWEIIQQ